MLISVTVLLLFNSSISDFQPSVSILFSLLNYFHKSGLSKVYVLEISKLLTDLLILIIPAKAFAPSFPILQP